MSRKPKVGDRCPDCGAVLYRTKVTDCRTEDEKRRRPLKKSEKSILACSCLHPGDYMIGGFF